MKKGEIAVWLLLLVVCTIRVVSAEIRLVSASDYQPCFQRRLDGTVRVVTEPERKDSGQVFIVVVKNATFVQHGSTDILSVKDDFTENSITDSKVIDQGLDRNNSCEITNAFIRIKTPLYPEYYFGETLNISGKLSKPFDFKSDGGRTFDYSGYLAKSGVYMEIKSTVVSTTTRENTSLRSILFFVKRKFVDSLERVLGEPHSALASGLVVGEKNALGKDLLDDFRTVGLMHIIVLSGYNITIVSTAIKKIFDRFGRVPSIILGAISIIMFGMLVGGGATVVRSCIMAVIALVADLIRRDYGVSRALLFSGIIMIIHNPLILIHDPSFQLSFLATLGLILLASPIEKRLSFITEKFSIRGIISSTLATQIFVSPFILHMMGQMSIVGMFVNILVLPLVPLTMLVVALTGLAGMALHALSIPFGWISYILLSYEIFMVESFAKFPLASFSVPPFSMWIVAVCYMIITIFIIFFISENAYNARSKFASIVCQLIFLKKSSM